MKVVVVAEEEEVEKKRDEEEEEVEEGERKKFNLSSSSSYRPRPLGHDVRQRHQSPVPAEVDHGDGERHGIRE